MRATGADRKPAVLVLLWVAKLGSAGTLAYAALGKFTGAANAVEMFMVLEMEPSDRILIGAIETLAALLKSLGPVGLVDTLFVFS